MGGDSNVKTLHMLEPVATYDVQIIDRSRKFM